MPIVFVEGEKSSLALMALASRNNKRLLALAMGGAYGWRARIGKQVDSRGQRVDENGPLPELSICAGREVFIMLDSNAATNHDVRKAQRELAAHLLSLGAIVRIVLVPALDGVNGPDDLIAVAGDSSIIALLDEAPMATELAVSEAEAAITTVGNDKNNTRLLREALDAVAAVPDKLEKERLGNKLADAVRGRIGKQTVVQEIGKRRKQQEEKAATTMQQLEETELRLRQLDLPQLVNDLENFFVERGHIPEGGALVLAYFTLNSYVFDLFDTTPYICLESATPRCGKSTVERLLGAVCAKARSVTAMNEPIFRLIDSEHPTLLIDEAEGLEGHSDRAQALRTILNEGYKKGARVPRCIGEQHEIEFFDVYCPKLFACIGGVTGALLDRCIVLHMERLPAGKKLRSSRLRVLKRDTVPLIENLKAYAVQSRNRLEALYNSEPDEGYWELKDREDELWGPLMIHARTIGKAAEEKLLAVVRRFVDSKADIEAEDSQVAKAIAMLEALEAMTGEEFKPGDLVGPLEPSEAWASTFGKAKGSDEKTRHKAIASNVGRFLRRFRLKGIRRGGFFLYNRQAAIGTIRVHTPENYRKYSSPGHTPERDPDHPDHPDVNNPASQVTEKIDLQDHQDHQEHFTGASQNRVVGTQNHPASRPSWAHRPQCPGCGGLFGAEFLAAHMAICKYPKTDGGSSRWDGGNCHE